MNKNKFMVLAILGFVSFASQNVLAATTLYEKKEIEIVTKGVTYENSLRATEAGIQNIHVLTVDLTNEYVTVGPAINEDDYGLRDSTLNLLKDSNAIAGVNGDFFGTANKYSASFGPEFIDGDMVSLTTGVNREKNEFASFYLEKDNNPFILYLKPEIDFKTNGKENMEVYSINKITDMVFPVIVTREAMETTQSVDNRFANTLKIVVEDGFVTYKSKRGEVVDVPENGYVCIIGESMANYFSQFFDVGQTAELIIRGGIDYNNIQSAIGGGGRILLNGEVVSDTGTVILGRQPRTALGISEDKTKIILMAVDGRGDSIGATHKEMASLLREYGAYNALHLDGGGSTTMAVSTVDDPDLVVVTTPSDGYNRNVINALGVYNNAPDDLPMTELKIDIKDGFNNSAISVDAYGLNDGYSRIELDENLLTYSADVPGQWNGKVFYPTNVGAVNITVTYNEEFTATDKARVKKLAELRPNHTSVALGEGDSIWFSFTGISDEGEEIKITSGVNYEFVPSTMGSVLYNTFTSTGEDGYIKATVGDVSTYIRVSANQVKKALNDFESEEAISFLSYNGLPEAITGSVGYSNEFVNSGLKSLSLNYNFPLVHGTQAAYLKFDEPILLKENPTKLYLDVYGDNSQNWLRGQVVDSNGTTHTIDFATNIDWTGYKQVSANIPTEVKYPISLSRIYVATTLANETNKTGTLYFDNLKGAIMANSTGVEVPVGNKYVDKYKQSIVGAPTEGSYDITVIGDWYLPEKDRKEDYNTIRNDAMKSIKENATQVFYAGETDYTKDIGVPVYQWVNGYDYFTNNNFAVFQMLGANSGLIARDSSQWTRFTNNLKYTPKKDVLLLIDKNPLNFTNGDELELFKSVLAEAKENGKRIFVVSSEGTSTTDTNIDGVRYINLGSLFDKNANKNSNFKTLRFRITGDNIIYDIK